MNTHTRRLIALAGASFVTVSSAACDQTPTMSETFFQTAPSSLRRDNGMGYGSGNRSERDSISAVLSNEITADTPARNGMGYGSGN